MVEQNAAVIGFAMARLDYGDFGRVSRLLYWIPSVCIRIIRGKGWQSLLSQLLGNLAALQVNSINTQLQWDNASLLEFLANCGFVPVQNLVLTKSLLQ